MSWSDCLVLSDDFPRANKTHVCDECSSAINPGEPYNRQSVLFDHSVYTIKTCGYCAEWVRGLAEFVDLSEGWRLGEFVNVVRDQGCIGKAADGQYVYQASGRYDGSFGAVFCSLTGKEIEVKGENFE